MVTRLWGPASAGLSEIVTQNSVSRDQEWCSTWPVDAVALYTSGSIRVALGAAQKTILGNRRGNRTRLAGVSRLDDPRHASGAHDAGGAATQVRRDDQLHLDRGVQLQPSIAGGLAEQHARRADVVGDAVLPAPLGALPVLDCERRRIAPRARYIASRHGWSSERRGLQWVRS